MKELFSIKAREQTYRIILLGSFIAVTIIAIASLWYANKSIQESKKNIYVLKNDQALVRAVSTDLTNSYNILTRAAVVRINQLSCEMLSKISRLGLRSPDSSFT